MMNKGIVIFDADGTLFNTLPGIYAALEDVYRHFKLGIFNTDDGMKFIGPPIKESLTRYNGLSEKDAEIATKYYRKVYVEKYIDMSTYYEGAEKVLLDIKNDGYQIALATMKTLVQVERLFEIVGGREIFDYFETAHEDGTKKKYQMIERIRGKSKSELVVMVGDTEHDLVAANKAGVKFIGVSYGYGFKRNEKYDFLCINSICELVDMLKRKGVCSK